MNRPGQALTDALLKMATEGKRPRCGDWQDGSPWLSEDERLREIAAGWCHGCPIWTECDLAAKEHRVTAGVWAGRDRTRESRR